GMERHRHVVDVHGRQRRCRVHVDVPRAGCEPGAGDRTTDRERRAATVDAHRVGLRRQPAYDVELVVGLVVVGLVVVDGTELTAASGSSTVRHAPPARPPDASPLAARTSPCMAVTSSRTMAKARPDPVSLRRGSWRATERRSNTWGWSSAAMPCPSSLT